MSNQPPENSLTSAANAQELNQEELFQLIAGLSGCLDRAMLIETVETLLGTKSIEDDNCVRFNDLAVMFDRDGRVSNIHRIIDGAGL